jgi:NAD(P)H-dependent flavin oxidoreductase YrpB (nitropropane dioxygenase family)
MPLQGMLVQEANLRIERAGNEELAFYPTGQAVGMTNDERDCKTVIYEMINDYIEAVERLSKTLE